MKKYLLVLFILFGLISCSQLTRQAEEARQARKRSDSILKAFREVNDQLDSINSTIDSKKDSIYQLMNDSSLRR